MGAMPHAAPAHAAKLQEALLLALRAGDQTAAHGIVDRAAALGWTSDDLRCDEADFSRAAAQIENSFSGFEVAGGISAPVILFDHFFWNDPKVARIVVDWTTQGALSRFCSSRVSLFNRGFRIDHNRGWMRQSAGG